MRLHLGEWRVEWGSKLQVSQEQRREPLDFSLQWEDGEGLPYWTALGLQLHAPFGLDDALGEDMPIGVAYARDVEMFEAGKYPTRKLRASPRWQAEFAAHRHTGETWVVLTREGQPVAGAMVVVNFLLGQEDQVLYDQMVADLQREDPGFARTGDEGAITGRSERNLGALGQLGARWEALRRAYRDLESALPPILANPRDSLTYSQTTIELRRRGASRDLAGAIPTPGTGWTYNREGTALLPQRMTLRHAQSRLDIPANRYVRDTVELLVGEARGIERAAGGRASELQALWSDPRLPYRWWGERVREVLASYSALASDAARLRRRCLEGWVRESFLAHVTPAAPRATDLVWRDNPYYRRVRRVRARLEDELRRAQDMLYSDAVMPTLTVNQTYELWLAMITLRTLCAPGIGCKLVKKGGRPVGMNAPGSYLLNRGSDAELLSPTGKRLVLRFDMAYPVAGTGPVQYGVDRAFWREAKRRPDLAIEVWDDKMRAQVPRIIILDATWSMVFDAHAAKYLYRETIRDFTRADDNGKPARPVIASWVVYPGDASTADYEEDYRTGRLPLTPGPGAGATLAPYLTEMLKRTGALPE